MTLWKAARYLLLVLVLLGLGSYVAARWEEFAVVRRIEPGVLLVLWALHVVMFVLMAFPLLRVVRSFGLDISFRSWIRVYTTSRLLNAFAPQAASAYRIAELKLSHRFPISSHLAALSVFTLLSRIYTLLLVFLTVLFVDADLRIGAVSIAPVLGIATLLLSALLLLAAGFGGRFRGTARRLLLSFKARPAVADEMLQILRRRSIQVEIFVFTLVNYILVLISHRICFLAIESDSSYAHIAVLRLSRSVLDIIPLTPGNFGVTEAVYGSLSESMANTGTEGIIVSAIITVASLLSVLTAFLLSSFIGKVDR